MRPSRNIVVFLLVILITGCRQKELIIQEAPTTKQLEEVQFITSDIDLFWKMFDAESPLYTESEIMQQYFKEGTPALQQFYQKQIQSPKRLITLLNSWEYRQYFEDIRTNTKTIETQRPKIIAAMRSFQKLYPQAIFTDITFVIGALNTGGVILPTGQMVIAAEMVTKDVDTDTEFLSPWLQSVLQQPEYLPVVIIHELVHQQQRQFALANDIPVGGRTLLDRALLEGSADFITDLILDNFLTKDLLAYGDKNEAELWDMFKQQMNQRSYSQWLYNGRTASEHPADIGYYIGYKITHHYYKQAANKKKAIKKIIQMKNGNDFLKASGYADSLN